ncbi:sensor histidine kinase [Rhodoligotrophos defluvii]|uniref:sensor histidine kinase n=1 Tax=Rhodoligotrophos defluvii TaxID=2561934 RepID=UPI0010CA1E66|nr:HAMP domain-containing sensor histidine kinase [Rhodoligotrophos defluvii]
MGSQHPRLLTGAMPARQSLLSRYAQGLQQVILHRSADLTHQAALVEVELASKAKSDFIARMSHELRTPLNAIMGFAHILSQLHQADNRTQEYTGYISEAAEHLLDTVNRMLDLSKIQAGSMTLARDPFRIQEVVPAAIRAVDRQARERNHTITADIPEELPAINGDVVRIKQMLVSLLSNAVKFTPEGGAITVSARVENEVLALRVVDTGIGMTPAQVQAAVLPFGQGYAVNRRGQEGIGLGLALCAAVVHLHRGRLDIRSVPGEGTTVTVHLPMGTPSVPTGPADER